MASLQAEFERLQPMAQALQKQTKCSNREAWKRVVVRSRSSRASVRRNYPSDNLVKVLVRYLAWTNSSSGCERNFSRLEQTPSIERSRSNDDTERRTLLAMVREPDEAEEQTITRRTRQICISAINGGSRERTTGRIDRGVKQKLLSKG